MKNLKRIHAKLCLGILVVFGLASCEQKKEKTPVTEPEPMEINAPRHNFA